MLSSNIILGGSSIIYIYILEKCILLNATKWRLNGIEWWLVTKWHWILSEWLRKCTCHSVACHSVDWMVPARFQRKVAFCLSLFKGSRLTSLKNQYNFSVYQQRIVTFSWLQSLSIRSGHLLEVFVRTNIADWGKERVYFICFYL